MSVLSKKSAFQVDADWVSETPGAFLVRSLLKNNLLLNIYYTISINKNYKFCEKLLIIIYIIIIRFLDFGLADCPPPLASMHYKKLLFITGEWIKIQIFF